MKKIRFTNLRKDGIFLFINIQLLSSTIQGKRNKISEYFYMLTFKLSSELNIWKAQKLPNSRRLEVNQTTEAFIRFAFLHIQVLATYRKSSITLSSPYILLVRETVVFYLFITSKQPVAINAG